MSYFLTVLIRCVAATVIGGLIGSERAKHGRAAGIRTHILVCLGACLTSMTSLYIVDVAGYSGDIFRISAQVISGIGFLGAGMIIHKNNSIISGLTTAAGIWATGVIGVALGYCFYLGAIIVALLDLFSVILLAKLEKSKKSANVFYCEIDNMSEANRIIKDISEKLGIDFSYHFGPPKSMSDGHLGATLVFENSFECDVNNLLENLLEIEGMVYAESEGN